MKKGILGLLLAVVLSGCITETWFPPKNSAPKLTAFLVNGHSESEIPIVTQNAIYIEFKDEDGDAVSSNIIAKGTSCNVEKINEHNYSFKVSTTTEAILFSIELKDSKGNVFVEERSIRLINAAPKLESFLLNGFERTEVRISTTSSIFLGITDENKDIVSTKITVNNGILEKKDEQNYTYQSSGTVEVVTFVIELKDSRGAISTQTRNVEVFKPGSVTVMIYMAADNNLNDIEQNMSQLDLDEIKSADINSEKINVVILGDFQKRDGNTLNGIYAKEGKTLVQKTELGIVNTGNKETLKTLLSYSKKNYPSERYILSLWGHGTGWKDDIYGSLNNPSIRKSINIDSGMESGDNGFGDSLDLWEVEAALTESGIGKLDILYTDACLMGGIEFAYQMKDKASYICVSPELTPGPGGDYKSILEFINSNAAKPAIELAKGMQAVNLEGYKIGGSQYNYSDWNPNERDNVVFSVFETFKLNALKQKIDEFAIVLSKNENKSIIKSVRENVLSYNAQDNANTPDSFVDIGSLADKIAVYSGTSAELKTKAQALSIAIKECVINVGWQNGYINGETTFEEGTSGISIYIDMYNASSINYYYSASRFARESTAWIGLLGSYQF